MEYLMNGIYVCAQSMLTPLGADAGGIKAAIDAGMSSYQECDVFGEGEPLITFSPVPEGALAMPIPRVLPGMSPPQIRMLHLATFALADIAPQLPQTPLPLFLAGPEPYYQPNGINSAFIENLQKTTGVCLDLGNSRCIATGRAGVIQSVATAYKYFEATGAPYALVGGVDSFYDIRTLGILEEDGRLLGNGSSDGFVPGEAAAFLLLASPEAPEVVRENSLFVLHRPSVVHEPGHILGSNAYTGEALAAAFKRAVASANEPVSEVYVSENGEMHYTKEVSIAMLRNHKMLRDERKIYRPAECFGDLGSAFAAVAIGLAGEKAAQDSCVTVICASSDGGPRGALCVSAV